MNHHHRMISVASSSSSSSSSSSLPTISFSLSLRRLRLRLRFVRLQLLLLLAALTLLTFPAACEGSVIGLPLRSTCTHHHHHQQQPWEASVSSTSGGYHHFSDNNHGLLSNVLTRRQRTDLRLALRRQQQRRRCSSSQYYKRLSAAVGGDGVAAMAIPGYGVAEQVLVGGFSNFLSIYNLIITARILLSWFPQSQGIAVLQPVYAVTDPFLNLFRGIIPPLFGLDFSPILAFFLLNVLTNATAAVGCEYNNYHHNDYALSHSSWTTAFLKQQHKQKQSSSVSSLSSVWFKSSRGMPRLSPNQRSKSGLSALIEDTRSSS